jgi:hypothetical protein
MLGLCGGEGPKTHRRAMAGSCCGDDRGIMTMSATGVRRYTVRANRPGNERPMPVRTREAVGIGWMGRRCRPGRSLAGQFDGRQQLRCHLATRRAVDQSSAKAGTFWAVGNLSIGISWPTWEMEQCLTPAIVTPTAAINRAITAAEEGPTPGSGRC